MKSSIYKITNQRTDKYYIGSTTRNVDIRFKEHKRKYIMGDDNTSSFNVFMFAETISDISYTVLQKCYNEDVKLYERKHIQEHIDDDNCVNNYVPFVPSTKCASIRDWKNDYNRVIVCCSCGEHISRRNITRHKRTMKHHNIISVLIIYDE